MVGKNEGKKMASWMTTIELNSGINKLQADILAAKRLTNELRRENSALKAGIAHTSSGKCAVKLANKVLDNDSEIALLNRQIKWALAHPYEMVVEFYL